jgi:hypothetical protein
MAKLRRGPVKQRLRRLRFRVRASMRRQELRSLERAMLARAVVPTSARLRPPAHHYMGHRGPWIEDFFFREFVRGALGDVPATYLPVFWTDYYLHAQTHLYSPAEFAALNAEIERVLEVGIERDRPYFTILEYDHPIWDWHRFPSNVLVFSAGGGGDVPIPLLNGDRAFEFPPKDILVSFMGRLDGASDARGVRGRMYEACRDIALFGHGGAWRDVMRRSTFTLCPRGLGRASFRLYEALSCGSIPIYVWDDVEWLPYRDALDWNSFAISVHVDDVHRIPALVAAHDDAEIRRKQARIRELHDEYFTMAGTCRQIARRLRGLALHDIRAITARRVFDA